MDHVWFTRKGNISPRYDGKLIIEMIVDTSSAISHGFYLQCKKNCSETHCNVVNLWQMVVTFTTACHRFLYIVVTFTIPFLQCIYLSSEKLYYSMEL